MKFGSNQRLETNNNSLTIELWGNIDDQAELPDKLDLNQIKVVKFDFGGVLFINSVGIAKWISYMGSFEANSNLKIEFYNCPKVIIDQVNSILGFLPKNGEVVSFHLPIFCTQCKDTFHITKESNNFDPSSIDLSKEVTEKKCENFPGCRKNFEVDVTEASFFRFLNRK